MEMILVAQAGDLSYSKSICNSMCTNLFWLKRWKSDCVNSVEDKNDEHLMYLTFVNLKM